MNIGNGLLLKYVIPCKEWSLPPVIIGSLYGLVYFYNKHMSIKVASKANRDSI